jgi:YidC/Oxa1 family membrane protein insertase
MSFFLPPENNETGDKRNLIVAVIMSVMVLLAYEAYVSWTGVKHGVVSTAQVEASVEVHTDSAEGLPAAPAMTQQKPAQLVSAASDENIQTTRRVPIHSNVMEGSIALTGGRVDVLSFPQYSETADGEGVVSLFSNDKGKSHFFDAGWVSESIQAPDGNAKWLASGGGLSPETPLTLTWSNNTGQVFHRTYTMDASRYVLTIQDKVVNEGPSAVALSHYAQLHKTGVLGGGGGMKYNPERSTFFNHMGPVSVVDGIRAEPEYKDVLEQNSTVDGQNGWIGMTGRYFMAALVPSQGEEQSFTFKHTKRGDDFFTALVQAEPKLLTSGASLERSLRLYVGPRQISELKKENISLDSAVNYGWFDFIARPLYSMIMWFQSHVGNMGAAIILSTIVLKILLLPLANKSYRSMAKMKLIQPEMEKMKERYSDNREQMGMAMMELYKKHKVNPMSGCWPMLVQIPIFFAFYKTILISFEFRHAVFIEGWVNDLSAQDPFFILPVLMGLSMYVQQKLSPAMGDPTQQKVMRMLPIIFTVMFLFFPAALVLYWLVNNVLSILQQYILMRSMEKAQA